jgi:hypothetical protein
MKIHDVIALIEDLPQHNLKRGQVGTIIEAWESGVFEVEFANTNGVAYAMVALRADQMMLLRWQPADSKQSA